MATIDPFTDRTGCQLSSIDAGDAFAALFDSLVDDGFDDPPAQAQLAIWYDAEDGQAIADRVRKVVLATGALPGTVLDAPAPERFMTLVGLDRALWEAHPLRRPPPALRPHAERLADHGTFTTPSVEGLVLPRGGYPAKPVDWPETLSGYLFGNVRVQPAHAARLAWHLVDPVHDITPDETGAGLRVAAVPFLESPTDVLLTEAAHGPRRGYVGTPNPAVDWAKRVNTVLGQLDASGAVIAVCPELSLDDEVLQHWRQAIVDTAGNGSLRWILAGSGDVNGPAIPPGAAASRDLGLPVNRAVILDRASGEVVHTQDKRLQFSMAPTQVRGWPSATNLSGGPIDELIALAPRLAIMQSAVGRIAVAICEDLGRDSDDDLIAAASPSLVLAPIYGPPLKERDWATDRATQLARNAGPDVVVNSSHGVFPTHRDGTPGPVLATACCVMPVDIDTLPEEYLEAKVHPLAGPATATVALVRAAPWGYPSP